MSTLNPPLTVLIGHTRHDSGQYIGRGSALGNPFRTTARTQAEHERVVAQYHRWLWDRIQAKDPEVCAYLNKLKVLATKGSITLTCYCRRAGKSGLPCHGDIVSRCIQWMVENDITL